MLYVTLSGPAVIALSACSNEAGHSTVAPEQGITQDISAVRSRSTTTLPASESLGQRPSNREPSGPARRCPQSAHLPMQALTGRQTQAIRKRATTSLLARAPRAMLYHRIKYRLSASPMLPISA
jgi:hypothetical protein